ncbi:peptidase M14 [Luteimonas sp. BDR2-5]|uniref:M14 family zinc carboxypeptidase n=1 Tax=Proluteimonas luteida TaxID=2878685 RepID=UPI001E2B3068|nr:M14 family zinc carboxypeptidase [Luteimonas sp. BDR2-5]MCD9028774.1 peptidase M14 [Luteimonas sp. BDR2-5]
MSTPIRALPLLALLLCAVLLPAPVAAQTAYYFPDAAEADFDPAIPTPEAFLGYPVGSHYTRHDRIVDYLRELARLSDRVHVEDTGRSYEERPLLAVLVTSPGNHARREQLRAAHATLADPAAPDVDPAQVPVVVGLYYSVHGNETSSGEAMLLTAYYLAASRAPEVQRWLDAAIVLIDPAQNPDGRDRAANWHNAWKSNPPVADPLDKEHVEPFPMGRTNHYFTDLNRDWLAITQRETRPKIALFHQWLPNVQIDFHEMGAASTYYFEPSPSSMHSPLLPQASYDFNVTLARYHAQALDGLGSLYYTKENFDNFSPVYGSTYPDFHGGVGVTVEQGSSRGLVQDTAGGPLEFRFTIRNQLAVGLATIRGAVAEHAGLFALQKNFFRSALAQGRRHGSAAFVFGDEHDASLSRQLLDLLLLHRIEVHALAHETTIDGRRFVPGSAWVVPSAQPQFRLVHSIFEDTPEVKESVYGSTSYAIAPAYGLQFAALRRLPATAGRVTALPEAVAGVAGGQARYAYAVDWRDAGAARVLAALLARDIRVRAAFQPFTARAGGGDMAFSYGTLVVPVAGQPLDAAALHAAVDAAAREAGVVAHALTTGQSIAGVDLGSDSIRPLRAPKIALVMGQGVNATEIGSTWFALSERVGWPATRLDPSQLARVPLGQYTSIVLAGGNYGDWSEATVKALRAWIEAGGSLVTFGSASQWAIEKKLADGLAEPTPKDAADTGRADFGARRDTLAEDRISGNLVSADADISHPLAFGVPRRDIVVNKETDVVLPAAKDRFSTVVRIDDAPRVNGFLSARNRARLPGAPWAVVAATGQGSVVLFADDPAHRKYWHGTERLLLNALFLSDQLVPSGRR